LESAPSRTRPPRNRIVLATLWLAGLLLSGLLAWTGPDSATGYGAPATAPAAGAQAHTYTYRSGHVLASPPAADCRSCLPRCGPCECEDPCLPLPVVAARPEAAGAARVAPAPSLTDSRPPRHRGRGPPVA